MRLRQAVLAARDLETVASELRSALSLGEPFRDEGVGLFGLANTVFNVGDCFIEVVSPTQPDTTAGRYLDRQGGDCGYMVIFDVEQLDGARARAQALGIRTVWEIDLPDISTAHLHPADMRGAIVSIDSSRPYGSWRWGGPAWTGTIGAPSPGRLVGATVAVAEPIAVAERWAEVLGVAVLDGAAGSGPSEPQLALSDGEVRFREPAAGEREGVVEIAVESERELPGGASELEIGGVRVRRVS